MPAVLPNNATVPSSEEIALKLVASSLIKATISATEAFLALIAQPSSTISPPSPE